MKIFLRIILDIFSLIIVLCLPWWLSLIILFFVVIKTKFYPEVIFFGWIIDLLYGHNHTFVIMMTTYLLIVLFLKTKIRT